MKSPPVIVALALSAVAGFLATNAMLSLPISAADAARHAAGPCPNPWQGQHARAEKIGDDRCRGPATGALPARAAGCRSDADAHSGLRPDRAGDDCGPRMPNIRVR